MKALIYCIIFISWRNIFFKAKECFLHKMLFNWSLLV